jgi:hypothetical protein
VRQARQQSISVGRCDERLPRTNLASGICLHAEPEEGEDHPRNDRKLGQMVTERRATLDREWNAEDGACRTLEGDRDGDDEMAEEKGRDSVLHRQADGLTNRGSERVREDAKVSRRRLVRTKKELPISQVEMLRPSEIQ